MRSLVNRVILLSFFSSKTTYIFYRPYVRRVKIWDPRVLWTRRRPDGIDPFPKERESQHNMNRPKAR